MGLLSETIGQGIKAGSGLLDEATAGIKQLVKKAEDFLPWDEEVSYVDEATNGVITLAKFPDGRTSVINLEVPEEFRGKGVAKKLQAKAMNDNPNLTGQVSSKKAATSAYNLGRRPIDNPDASLDDVYKAIDDMSSVNMATPDAIKAFNGGVSPVRGLLDMDTPSRMARATDQGFDTDNVMYHGTDAPNITEFKTGIPTKRYTSFTERDVNSQGVFLSPDIEDARSYGSNVGEYYVKNGKTAIPIDEIPASSKDSSAYNKAFDDYKYALEPVMREVGEDYYVIEVNGGLSTIDIDDDGQWLKNATIDGFEWDWLDNPEVVRRLRERGYSTVQVGEPNDISGRSLMVLDPSNIRSVDAAFDPAKASSSNLLASKPAATIGAGILGALAASQSNDTYANYSPSNLARLRNDNVGGYQAAQSPQLASAAGLMGQINERGVDDPLMGMVSPRVPSELMNKIAYNDKRGVADYLKAAAGLLGLY